MSIKKKVTVIVEIGEMKIEQSTTGHEAWWGDNPMYFASEAAKAAGEVTGEICAMIEAQHGSPSDSRGL